MMTRSKKPLTIRVMLTNTIFFFFSSRRRHTRSKRDWSSDVCSSDLAIELQHVGRSVTATVSDGLPPRVGPSVGCIQHRQHRAPLRAFPDLARPREQLRDRKSVV